MYQPSRWVAVLDCMRVGVLGGIAGPVICEDIGSAGVVLAAGAVVFDLASWVLRPAGAGLALQGQMSLIESINAAASSAVWNVI